MALYKLMGDKSKAFSNEQPIAMNYDKEYADIHI